MSNDIQSLKQVVLTATSEVAEFDPATHFINKFKSIQVHEAETALLRIAEDIMQPAHRRLCALDALKEIKIIRINNTIAKC